MKANQLVPGKRYSCSCPSPLVGEFWKLDGGEPVFLVGPRVSAVILNYEISSCKDGWKEEVCTKS
jgi:hypothetical protein